jgi:predicted CXXCH cytochrome family protein
MKHLIQVRHLLAGATLAMAVSACVKDKGTSTSPQLKDVAFVGYSTVETKQTTCGNCHVLKQQGWIKMGHANAWSDLEASGHAASYCYKCHTTNGATNAAADTAGYFTASESAKKYYQDVQCESCHGPGAAHVTTPDQTQPIPYITAGDSGLTKGCGACHSGTHNPFFEEWSSGAHGGLEAHASSYGGTCLQCHEGKAVNTRFGEGNVYVEASDATPMPITCVNCHDPHGNRDNPKELRFSVSVRDSTNLCIQCHHKRAVPDPTTWRGPHSPQGPTLLGASGWLPAGFAWDSTSIPTHADPTVNKGLCATCHVAGFSVNDASGKFAYRSVGHKFYAVPCLNAAGTPDTTNTCALTARTFSACATSGCHASEGAARAMFTSLDADLHYFADALWVDVNGDGKVDAGDTGLLMQVPSTEFKNRSAATAKVPLTVAEGAGFNVGLLNADMSHGVHNPPYLRSLLIATLQAVKAQYHLSPPAAVEARMAQEGARLGVRIATR